MLASEIRSRFLNYFAKNDHAIRPSSSLVPGDDPTLLFTNAGMVQFKKVFLGHEDPPEGRRRATTSQKCVRAGGKHNDLEQVGHTARHHTFFEMLGNFSFGDYFKRDAIRFAWEFITEELNVDPKLLRVTVHHTDDEARGLWREIAGLPDSRIYSLGDKDNFWQMADTGPCGPCSEIFIDLAHAAKDWRFPDGATGEWTEIDRKEFSFDAFVEGSEAGRFLEFWNLVFMQYDRQADGTMVPLPKPSVDTGAGLERIAAFMQGVTTNYHADLFAPLLEAVEQAVGIPYWGRESSEFRTGVKIRGPKGESGVVQNPVDPASFRVLADHARAVAFLLADGVFPSNEGRGYVLRRILRRGVRHAWLLGRKEPTLVSIVQVVIDTMGDVYPELRGRAQHILNTTRVEEQSFLDTIEGGLARFEQLAPLQTADGSTDIRGTISGEDAFRLYDTFGFPIDLTELMARERGYVVDIAGFEASLDAQRKRSQDERKSRKLGVSAESLDDTSGWERSAEAAGNESFVGYDVVETETAVTAVKHLADGRVAVLLQESPFYAESGGQISDHGEIVGDGWRVDVTDVRKVEGRPAAIGTLTGSFHFGRATARVPGGRRLDTERNHTATHLLQAALRQVLGESVHQAGSLVTPERLRFDFTHHGPVNPERLAEIEAMVNREIWRAAPVTFREMPYQEARASGAMALFGEKYGDVVRVVSIPDFSMELCGGTHVKNTAFIGLFKIVNETGVAAGVRRIEAVTGPGAYEMLHGEERTLHKIAELVKAPMDGVEKRVAGLIEERRVLERRLDEAMRGGGDQLQSLLQGAAAVGANGSRLIASVVKAGDVKELQALGDAIREKLGSGVGVLAASFDDGKNTLLVVVTDDLRDRGVSAGTLIKDLAAAAGGKGGGKPHMAQAGIPDAARFNDALARAPELVRSALGEGA
ncbi:MAG: Alanine-tRNA ligase, eukaryota/bacteria [Gemmatimonadetes bacterium]|nr:Alanine-tRNA ligase, eukaryota/bacteria [Gemmatimonadota bacterium]